MKLSQLGELIISSDGTQRGILLTSKQYKSLVQKWDLEYLLNNTDLVDRFLFLEIK